MRPRRFRFSLSRHPRRARLRTRALRLIRRANRLHSKAFRHSQRARQILQSARAR